MTSQVENRTTSGQPPLSASARRSLARLLIGQAADEPDDIAAPDHAQPEKAAPSGIPGAAQGYHSIALAAAHPEAQIISIEADPTLTRLHTLNVLPYRLIVQMRCAVSEQAGPMAMIRRDENGMPGLASHPQGTIDVVPLAELYRRLGWEAPDLLIIDPRMVLDADPGALGAARPVAVRRSTPGEPLPPVWRDAFPEATHIAREERNFVFFLRRESARSAPPRRVPAVDFGGGQIPAQRLHVASDSSAFLPIGETGFRLQPNGREPPPASLRVRHLFAGPRRFETGIRLTHPDSKPVRFTMRAEAISTGREIFAADHVLSAGQGARVGLDLPHYFGEVWLEFRTAMAEPDSPNASAWAEFVDPGFR